MDIEGGGDGAALVATIAVDGPPLAGRAALVRLDIVNRGATALLVSRRLNLMEGDLRFIAIGPAGDRRLIRGWQVDSGLDRVELRPGQSIVGAVNLLETGDGPAFPEPGNHVLTGEYFPSPLMEAVVSDSVRIALGAPVSPQDRAVAELLGDPALRKALVSAQPEAAPDGLRRLADCLPDTLEAGLARLILGPGTDAPPDWARAQDAFGTLPLALWVLSLASPAGPTGKCLADSLAAYFEERKGRSRDDAVRREALLILRREPLPAP